MRIVLLTQDEPLFVTPAIDYFLARTPPGIEVAGCIVFKPSPVGGKAARIGRPRLLLKTFGPAYFLRYGVRHVIARLQPWRGLRAILRRRGIPALRLAGDINDEQSLAMIRALRPDLLVSLAGNQIFRKPLIELAPLGCVNLHNGLLPQYRGLMPTFWAMRNGESVIGVSVFLVDEGIDSGPLLVQKRVPIDTDRLETLIRQTRPIGMDAMWEAIGQLRDGTAAPQVNDEGAKTYFSFPGRADVAAFRAAGKKLY